MSKAALGRREATRCKVCKHPEHLRINFMLATGGASLRVLAAKFEVSHDSLWYHKKHHISREYIAQCRVGPLQDEEQLRELCAKTGTSVLDNLRALNAGFVSRWLVALEAGSDDMLVSLGGQIRKNLELMARLTKELAPPSPTTVVNNTSISLYEAPQYVEMISALSLALRPYPEARRAVVDELRRLGSEPPLIEGQPRPREAA